MRNNIVRADLDALITYLQRDDPMLTQGEHVRCFEREWSKWLGVKHSVFVNSGSSANQITMAILKIRHPEGGDVIVPTLTWVSDIAAVLQNGFQPVFVDIDPYTLGMNNKQVLEKITRRTRAVFLTHAQGFDGLTDHLLEQLKERDITLIEDVCESHGAVHDDTKLGTFGRISNFSFYYAHHISTIEGGMICTDDPDICELARMLRSHGMVREASSTLFKHTYAAQNPHLNPDFIFAYAGFNMRNTELGALLGRQQLKRLDADIVKRTHNFMRFLNLIDVTKYRTHFKRFGSSNYAFPLILQKNDERLRDRLEKKMRDAGIEFRRGSSGGGNQLRQPYLNGIINGVRFEDYPEVEHVHFFGYYIGNFPDLSAGEVEEICKIVNAA